MCAFAVADDLLLINDISVDESEDLPKILGPLVEGGPLAALGRAHQQPGAAFSPATNKRQLLQTMKLAAPAIVKLQVPPCTCATALTALCQAIRCCTGRVSCVSTCFMVAISVMRSYLHHLHISMMLCCKMGMA